MTDRHNKTEGNILHVQPLIVKAPLLQPSALCACDHTDDAGLAQAYS